jgi:hypothetical protein
MEKSPFRMLLWFVMLMRFTKPTVDVVAGGMELDNVDQPRSRKIASTRRCVGGRGGGSNENMLASKGRPSTQAARNRPLLHSDHVDQGAARGHEKKAKRR